MAIDWDSLLDDPARPSYDFQLRLEREDISVLDARAIVARCGQVQINVNDSGVILTFRRSAPTRVEAIAAGIRDVEAAGFRAALFAPPAGPR